MTRNLFSVFFLILFPLALLGNANKNREDFNYLIQQDTLEEEIIDSTALAKINVLNSKVLTIDSIDVVPLKKNPFLTIGDMIKGQASGVYVQQPSAEPGTFQNILVRGLSGIQLTNRDINNNRAAVYVNGIPMSLENSFSYDIQLYDYNRIGPATDYASSIDMSSIESIEVIKDPIRLAELGPLASNGAIWITTFGGKSGDREISVNGYYGFNTKPSVSPYNAEYEDMFRQNFYSRYASDDNKLKYPGYLSDSTNVNYYGSSDWQDLYYSTASLYTVDLSLRGGSDRANFGFLGSHTKNAISADDTNLKRYNALFNVNMLPFEWMSVSSYINARRIERNRNRNLRDRYAEMAYLPDLSTPLAPNKNAYANYLGLYEMDAVDDNVTNHLQGNIRLSLDLLPNLNFSTSFALDYNEGIRDLFYPSKLMETINYMSTYYGYTQRFVFSNKLSYWKEFNDNRFTLSVGSDYSEDLYRYNFARAYDGPNDYIKLNVVEGNPNEEGYLEPKGGLRVLRYNNKEQFNLHSIFGKIGYSYKELFEFAAVLRWDGSSTVQRDSRWLFTPSAGAKWNLDKQLDLENLFNIQAGFSRLGKPVYSSRYASGPQYASSLGWSQDPTVSSYYGYAGISRDYTYGWTGYNLKWAYSDKYEVTFNNSFFNERLSTALSFYQRDDQDQIVLIPIPLEYGYTGQHKNGLAVRNQGVDATINGVILPAGENKLSWTSSLNINLNRNELTALPNGLTELQMDGRLLRVGESIDQFWLYQNKGIYNSSSDIPVNPSTGLALSNNGVPFEVGDAKWVDQNGDFVINEEDKVLKGRFTPKYYGGFNNSLTYKGFDLSFSFTYALGLDAINQRASNRYDFVNNEDNNTIGAVREIFQWQQDLDISKYPIYNVWSGTNPYREDQDLFLEDASYLKLRSVSFGYDLSRLNYIKSSIKTLRRAYVYVTANNVFTVTKFSGNDPELVNFNGIYDGYGLPLTQTYTLGIKLDL
ncbi:SusC/RagA family TonB-linked outer membrane protein [Sphingobacterium hungaricum]|uniref:SusC/RagA family TonB-linked outer membrane protein n=1 Tax=Sphingobacterium hungaricum TaxID=2082723 RepID=A0A928YQ98_9SPHI|nr:SusC/RagA family TonB-linked outer membrane protein [Sphingobacterium hungaricum]MBE8712800.1 SusC/RagA family TonB-linked outer membrane protein [Sphingobacterium hungaricum]